MWISKKKWQDLEKRVQRLEKTEKEMHPPLDEAVASAMKGLAALSESCHEDSRRFIEKIRAANRDKNAKVPSQ